MDFKTNIQSVDLLQEFERSISTLPGVEVLKFVNEATDANQSMDAYSEIRIKGNKTVHLLIQVKLSGYPRDLERISQTTKETGKITKKDESLPVIVSRAVSPGSRKMLQEQGIGYFDSGGSLYLPLSDGIFYIDRPAPPAERSLQNLYEGRSAQVLHVLLAEPDREWHVNELAERAGVSPYTVHRVFTKLEKESFLKRYGKGPDCVRTLKKPSELLDALAENYSFKQYDFQNYYKWAQSTAGLRDEIAGLLDENQIDYALTLGSGAELVAPFASSSERLYLIVEDSKKVKEAVRKADLEPVDDGANVTFLMTKLRAPFLNRQKIDDLWVAGDVQLYLDLSKWRARGKEQAEHLRRERLKF